MRLVWAALTGQERGGRRLPSLWRQVAVVARRSAVKWVHGRQHAVLDLFLVVMLGLVLGAVQVRGKGLCVCVCVRVGGGLNKKGEGVMECVPACICRCCRVVDCC